LCFLLLPFQTAEASLHHLKWNLRKSEGSG
jgi:hypothetical protein